MDVKQVVFAYLESKNKIPGSSETEKLGCYYLDSGVIDSLGIIEMITTFEEKFQIQFSSDDMQSTDFRTIGGLINLIERLRAQ